MKRRRISSSGPPSVTAQGQRLLRDGADRHGAPDASPSMRRWASDRDREAFFEAWSTPASQANGWARACASTGAGSLRGMAPHCGLEDRSSAAPASRSATALPAGRQSSTAISRRQASRGCPAQGDTGLHPRRAGRHDVVLGYCYAVRRRHWRRAIFRPPSTSTYRVIRWSVQRSVGRLAVESPDRASVSVRCVSPTPCVEPMRARRRSVVNADRGRNQRPRCRLLTKETASCACRTRYVWCCRWRRFGILCSHDRGFPRCVIVRRERHAARAAQSRPSAVDVAQAIAL